MLFVLTGEVSAAVVDSKAAYAEDGTGQQDLVL